MKLYRLKRILKKDELLTIEAYANDKVNVVLEQIRQEILDFKEKCNASDYLGCGILEIIDKHIGKESEE